MNIAHYKASLGQLKESITLLLEFAEKIGCEKKTSLLIKEIGGLIGILIDSNLDKYRTNYAEHYKVLTDRIVTSGITPNKSHLQTCSDWPIESKQSHLINLESQLLGILPVVEQLKFSLNLFNQIDHFNYNIVAIGANGCGKTSLTDNLKKYFSDKGIVISAQRILLVPKLDNMLNLESSLTKLSEIQKQDKSSKTPHQHGLIQTEFGTIISALIGKHTKVLNDYHELCQKAEVQNKTKPKVTKSLLNTCLEIWNSLIIHRTLFLKEGTLLMGTADGIEPYPFYEMSDGEKAIFYLIGQVLLAPEEGFIFIDEPEHYIHKSVLNKLWNELEKIRKDCVFFYLTHELDFASSRVSAKKFWIKSFTPPTNWDIVEIPQNNIPENLMLELLGSRNNILFCESEKGKIDENIYSQIFPKLTIIPVGGCTEVINHTKAFNKIKKINTKAYGLIDADFHTSSRLAKLKLDNIYSLKVTEIENLFLDENFLEILAANCGAKPNIIDEIKKNVIKEFEKERVLQASRYVSSRATNQFQETHLEKGATLSELEENYSKLISAIELKKWHKSKLKSIDKIISTNNYKAAITICHHKGLGRIVDNKFNITNFHERAFDVMTKDDDAKKVLRKYFPKELIGIGV